MVFLTGAFRISKNSDILYRPVPTPEGKFRGDAGARPPASWNLLICRQNLPTSGSLGFADGQIKGVRSASFSQISDGFCDGL